MLSRKKKKKLTYQAAVPSERLKEKDLHQGAVPLKRLGFKSYLALVVFFVLIGL